MFDYYVAHLGLAVGLRCPMVSILFFSLAFFMLFQVAEMLFAWSWYV